MNYRHVLFPFIRNAPEFCFAPAPAGCDGDKMPYKGAEVALKAML